MPCSALHVSCSMLHLRIYPSPGRCRVDASSTGRLTNGHIKTAPPTLHLLFRPSGCSRWPGTPTPKVVVTELHAGCLQDTLSYCSIETHYLTGRIATFKSARMADLPTLTCTGPLRRIKNYFSSWKRVSLVSSNVAAVPWSRSALSRPSLLSLHDADVPRYPRCPVGTIMARLPALGACVCAGVNLTSNRAGLLCGVTWERVEELLE